MLEVAHLDGVLLALGAAVSAAGQSLLVRKGTDEGSATEAVLVVISVNFLLLLPVVLLAYYPDYGLTTRSWLSFVAAGLVGTLLGRVFMYTSIDRIGASRSVPIVASNALIATVLGVVFLDESLSPIHGLGVLLVIGGVAGIAWETSQSAAALDRRDLAVGILIPLTAAMAYGWEPIFASVGFAGGTPAPVGLLVKTFAALCGFVLYLRWRDALPGLTTLRSRNVRWFLLAGVGNTMFLVGYYVALSIAPVSVVTPIIITNSLWVMVLSAVFMPSRLERVTWQLAVAGAVVVGGVILITAFG